jgi:hypothetical protein
MTANETNMKTPIAAKEANHANTAIAERAIPAKSTEIDGNAVSSPNSRRIAAIEGSAPTARATGAETAPGAKFGASGANANRRFGSANGATDANNALYTKLPLLPELIALTHSHYCKHCNNTFTCKSSPCIIPGDTVKDGKDKPKYPNYDISKIHPCREGKQARKRMAIMLGDKPTCIYGCDKNCNHPLPVSEGDERSVSEHTSKYSIDGITNGTEARTVHNAWNKAHLNKVKDSFKDTPWLADIAASFRNR